MTRAHYSSRGLSVALWLSACLGTIGPLLAEEAPLRFRRLGVEDGVSHPTVWDVAQDGGEYIWLVTETNVQRYDGYVFRGYTHDPADPHSLAARENHQLHVDRAGRVWVAAFAGKLSRYDVSLDRFDRFEPPFTATSVISVADDAEGRIWLGLLGAGLASLDPRTGEWRQWDEDDGLASNYVAGVAADAQGRVWATGSEGVYRLDREAVSAPGTVQIYPLPGDGDGEDTYGSGLALAPDGAVWAADGSGAVLKYAAASDRFEVVTRLDEEIQSLAFAPNGDLWILTFDSGLAIYDLEDDRLVSHRFDPSDPDSLSSDEVLGITFDIPGEAWIGTRNGLAIEDRDRSVFRVLRDRRDGAGLDGNNAQTMTVDRQGALWIGMGNGAVHRFDRSTALVETIFETEQSTVGPVEFLGLDRTGEIVLGGVRGTDRIDPRTGESIGRPAEREIASVRGFAETEDGSRWFASLNDGLVRLVGDEATVLPIGDDGRSIPDNGGYSVFVDGAGQVWGGFATGLARVDPATGAIRAWFHDPNDPSSLAGGIIPDIFEDSSGRLWIATYGTGLDRYDRATGTFEHFTTKDGLPSNFIVGIVEDDLGRLWISTNGGLSAFDVETRSFRNYSADDGLASSVFLMGGAARFEDGTLAFGGQGGVTLFHPNDLVLDSRAPRVALTSLSVGGVEVEPGESSSPLDVVVSETEVLTLGHRQGTFALEFSALDYSNPTQNRYAFQLEGFDEGWTEVDAANRRARYTNLDAGDYVFRVRGSNSDGVWNDEGATLRIQILPPWWQAWWAYTLYALLIVGTAAAYAASQNRRLERERTINAQLRQVDRLKNEFLANTSHELRTPLFGMTGLAESLIDGARGDLPGVVRDDLQMIVSSGRRLRRLVDDILDFSRLQDRELSLDLRDLNLQSLVELVVLLSRPLAEGKEIELVNLVPRDLPAVRADENRLQQILHNLVGNAIKFTERGTVVVSASVEGEQILVDVEDTGPGIAADELERIFEPFEQADASTARSFGGTGLGLAITRDLVQLHGGTLRADSVLGEGSRFRFSLPLGQERVGAPAVGAPSEGDTAEVRANMRLIEPLPSSVPATDEIDLAALRSEQESAPLRSRDVNPETREPAKILIVDDEPVVRQVLVNHLGSSGYRVIQAKNGPAALRRLEDEPDLVLLDIMMPRMSGFEVCDSIRQRYSIEQLPVIYLSAKNQVEDLLQGFATGANDYVSKPVVKAELIARVETHLKLRDLHLTMERLVEKRTHQVKRLGGLLPICSSCKKIRDDDGYWKEVENYLDRHSEASFTHGLCDRCIHELYPELEVEAEEVVE